MDRDYYSSGASGGVGFFGLLGIVFIVLKLLKVINWPWIWVLAPIWIPTAVLSVVMIVLVIIVNRRDK